MHAFTDTKGRAWDVEIHVQALRNLKAKAEVDLMDLADGQLLEQLSSRPDVLAQVLWVLVEAQAKAAGITPEAFAEGLAGDVIDDATAALLGELVDFFPSRRRAALKTALEKLNALENLAVEKAIELLKSDRLDKRLESELDALGEQLTASPESSASTPPD